MTITAKFMFRNLHIALLLITVMLVSSCGRNYLILDHGPLNAIAAKGTGTIIVKEFSDDRTGDRDYIGNGWEYIPKDQKFTQFITKCFADALKNAGYNVIIEDAKSPNTIDYNTINTILTGNILTFGIAYNDYIAICNAVVLFGVKAIDPISKAIIWQKDFSGTENLYNDPIHTLLNGFDKGAIPERAINNALNYSINNAIHAFSSDEFYNAIKSK